MDNIVLQQLTDALDGKFGNNNKLIAEEGLKWITTLINKNTNYGDSVFKQPVLAPDCASDAAIRVRMSDKVSRLNTLLTGDKDRVGESLSDTMSDLGSYCLLWLVNQRINTKSDTIPECPKCKSSNLDVVHDNNNDKHYTRCMDCDFTFKSDQYGKPIHYWRCLCLGLDNTVNYIDNTIKCQDCNKVFDLKSATEPICPQCGSYGPCVTDFPDGKVEHEIKCMACQHSTHVDK